MTTSPDEVTHLRRDLDASLERTSRLERDLQKVHQLVVDQQVGVLRRRLSMLNQFGPAGLLVLGLCLPWAYVGKPETARSVWAVVDLVGEGRDTGFEQTAVGLAIGLVILAVFVALFQPFFSNGRARLVPIGTGIAAALMTLVSMIAMGEAGLVSSGEGSTGSLGAAAFFVLLFAAGWLVLAPRDHH